MDKPFQRNGRAIFLAIFFAKLSWLWPVDSANADPQFTILYHEPVALQSEAFIRNQPRPDDAVEILRFDAFGRRFEVELKLVSRSNRNYADADFELFTGHVSAAPESWVRLMRRGDEISGMIHDVSDVYFIEPYSALSESLDELSPRNDAINVIYRLADTLVEPGMLACESQPANEHVNGQTAFTKLAAELQAANTITAASHIPTATIGIIADLDFFARFGSESTSEIESMFNTVNGIFSDQVGVEINVQETLIVSTQNQNPFSATTVGVDLLDELGEWRRLNQRDLGLTHLVTDRDLTGDMSNEPIAGLSFFGVPGRAGVCFARSGAGLSAWFGSLTALIIAHEIAHNFGAPHDGEPSGEPGSPNACESTPTSGFIMSATLTSPATDQFSACSLQEMQKVIAAASCLATSSAQAPAPANGGGGGGGGALNWPSLAILLLVAIRRRNVPDLCQTRRVAVSLRTGLAGLSGVRAPTTYLFGLMGLMAGCAHNEVLLECGGQDALLSAVFEYQFANNHSSIGQDASAYFIGLENGQDPDSNFLQRFDGHQPRVEPLSKAGRNNHRIIDSQTGKPALTFQVRNVAQSENGAIVIDTGYYEAELSASWNTLQGVCAGDEWLIEAIGPEILS